MIGCRSDSPEENCVVPSEVMTGMQEMEVRRRGEGRKRSIRNAVAAGEIGFVFANSCNCPFKAVYVTSQKKKKIAVRVVMGKRIQEAPKNKPAGNVELDAAKILRILNDERDDSASQLCFEHVYSFAKSF